MEGTLTTREERADYASRLALKGLLVVGLFVGYEWFMSGLTKIVRGGFPSGLAAELRDKSEGAVGWYKSFLDGTVIPNAKAFGVLIEVGELAIGIVFIGAAILLLLRWERLSYRWEAGVLVAVAVASVAAILMNISFHLANGSPHPWLIPKDGFDEGVDLDSLLPLIQLVFLIVAVKVLRMLRRDHRMRLADVEGAATPAAPQQRSRAEGLTAAAGGPSSNLHDASATPSQREPTLNLEARQRTEEQ